MAGFGPEDDHFVVELTYNYGIKQYQLGNDFQVITHFKKNYGFLKETQDQEYSFIYWYKL